MGAVLLLTTAPLAQAQDARLAPVDTVHVVPPTGEAEADRANVQAAFDAVRPGGVIQFAPGTYRLGPGAHLTVADVTVLGHPDGTTLHGCDPDAFRVDRSEIERAVFGCTGLYVQTERQTIRGLTFEYAWHGVVVGPYPTTAEEAAARMEGGTFVPPEPYPSGGHRIEGNTFRATPNGLRVLGTGTDTSVVRDNDFVDVFHAIGIYGAPLHFVGNRVTVEDPGRVPNSGHPGSAVLVAPGYTDCAGHVVAGNRIEGYPDAVYVLVNRGETCRGVEVRHNTIRAARVRIPRAWAGYAPTEEDSTMVGVPISLRNNVRVPWKPEADAAGVLEDVVVRGNRIVGAEGLGILVQDVSNSRIEGNTITGVQRRSPFPGITWDGDEQEWEAANGSGIWLSPGSTGIEVSGNTFEDVAGAAVVVEGDSNRVALDDPADGVRDLGAGNRVDRFVEVGGVRLHYLDFGGEGLPLVFVHSESWDASTFEAFAPRFTDQARVLAVTRPGYGASEVIADGFGVAAQAEALVAFLDALGIERAVFAGNSSPTAYLTYLAEHHPERVAGLVYLAGHLPLWLEDVRQGDPAGATAMAVRAFDRPADSERRQALMLWRPAFLDGDRPPIAVPTLAFASRSGTVGHERFSEALALVGSPLMADLLRDLPPSPFADFVRRPAEDPAFRAEMLGGIQDPEARAVLLRLADDPALQEAVWEYQQEVVAPALVDGQARFREAFDDGLRVARLDVPVVHGYEYRDAPDLVDPHLRRFLADLGAPHDP